MQAAWAPDGALEAAYARVSVRLSEAEQMPPGPGLAAALQRLQGQPMDCAGAVRATALWDRLISWASAQSMIAIAEAVRGGDLPAFLSGHDAAQIVAQDLAAMTHAAFATAMDRVGLVGQVGRGLPLSWEALDRGQLGLAHLKVLAKETSVCTPAVTQQVDDKLVPLAIAKGWTPTQLGKAAARAIIDLDPDGAYDRAVAAKACSDVVLFPDSHETASMLATGHAATMRRVMDSIDHRAEHLGRAGDPRPVEQRRLAALSAFVLGDQAASRPVVETVVTIDLTTLLGLTRRPGELSGYGPISAETARELSKDATLRRLLTDPITGTMVDLGRSRYRPTAYLRRLIDGRDRTCRFPGCSRRATDCDADHITAWSPGGHTSSANLHPLCRMHHNLKTDQVWTVAVNPDRSESWTSPLGFGYRQPTASYPSEPSGCGPPTAPADSRCLGLAG